MHHETSTYGEVEVQLTTFLKPTPDNGESSTLHPVRLTSGETVIGTLRSRWGDPTADMNVMDEKCLLPL